MPAQTRPATLDDLPSLVALLLEDAQARQAHDPALWALAANAPESVEGALRFALTAETQPFRQAWLVAEVDGGLVGLIHTARVPVPPIYAGPWGDPGLVMPEWFVAASAPLGTAEALLDAAEADLRSVGAELLLASFVNGSERCAALEARGYEPITFYLSKTDLKDASDERGIRAASEEDVEEIVRLSREHRRVLFALDPFWDPHAEADERFGNWMRKSLTLTDRAMLVAGLPGALEGYVIAQPASRLHFPPAHDISDIGVIDDFVHHDFLDADALLESGAGALLAAAEAEFSRRGDHTAFVVCPAPWASKVSLLKRAGYRTAMTWMIRR